MDLVTVRVLFSLFIGVVYVVVVVVVVVVVCLIN
jgi:hypothetical protein